MNKAFLVTSIGLAFVSLSQTAFATPPKPPALLEPLKGVIFPIKKSAKFSWLKVKNISKYRLIISNNAKFTNYDVANSKCVKNTAASCFTATTQSPTYTLPAKNPLLQKHGGFFWQVQAIGGSVGSSTVLSGNNVNNKNAGEVRPFSVSESLAIPKLAGGSISVAPQIATAGSVLMFNATLTTELPDGYDVKIDFGDGEFKTMEGSGVDFTYSAAIDIIGEDQNFTVTIFDANDEEVDSSGDSFTITAAGDSTPVEPTPIVVKPDPVVKPTPEPVKPVTVTVPNVSTISVAPQSVVQGNTLTFSTTLSASLPSGYSVKVDYGNGLFAMSGSGTNYSLSASPTSSHAYSIGVYDAKNTLKSNSQTGNFSVTAPNFAPTLSLISGGISATIGTPYVTQLQANDSNLSLIFMDWGDGASESKNATSGATVSFSHTYNSEAAFTWNATAYDLQDATSSPISKTVTVAKAAVVVTPPVTKTTGYTKIANDGSLLSDDAKLGTAPTDWACTRDNKTGLIWEVKTDDDGLRDMDWRYSWYEPDASKNGGFEGYQNGNGHPEWCKGSDCDTYAFTNAVNKQGLCGAKDWRMPTIDELKGLLTTTSTVNQPLNEELYIDSNYFPNSNYSFWSSSPSGGGSNAALLVDFGDGRSYLGYEGGSYNVRLVR